MKRIALFLMLLCLAGCLSPKAAEKIIGPGDIPEGLVDVDAKVDAAVWGHFLENLLKNVEIKGDTLEPGAEQQKTDASPTVNVAVEVLKADGLTIVLAVGLVLVAAYLGWKVYIRGASFDSLAQSVCKTGDAGRVREMRKHWKANRPGRVARWVNPRLEKRRSRL